MWEWTGSTLDLQEVKSSARNHFVVTDYQLWRQSRAQCDLFVP